MFTSYQLKKISQFALTIVCLTYSVTSLCSDYNGNILSPSKIVFNNNSSKSYIQSAMQKTVNFDGLIDQTFGTNQNLLGSTYLNSIAPNTNTNNDQCTSIALQADGKIVMGGYTLLNGTAYRFAAARLNADGSPDTTFGDNGSMYLTTIATDSYDDICKSIALQADGKIVMGGYTLLNGTAYRFAAARLNADGSPDTTFGDNGSMYLDTIAPESTRDECHSIALQTDGKIIMGGFTLVDNSYPRFAAARLNTDGSPDTTFGDNGSMYLDAIAPGSTNDKCNSIALQANGKIVMGGFTLVDNSYPRFAAARLNTDGSPDTTFGDNGSMYLDPIAPNTNNDQCYSIVIQPDDKIVMGGYTLLNGTGYRFAAARLNIDGFPDVIFGSSGSMYLDAIAPGSNGDECNSIALQPDGKIVMGGYTFLTDAGYRFAAARLDTNGSPDTTFGDNGSMYLDAIAFGSQYDLCNSIAIQPDGKIVMGGRTYVDLRFAAARLINPMTLQSYQTSYMTVGNGMYS